jgi:hypothetical protein
MRENERLRLEESKSRCRTLRTAVLYLLSFILFTIAAGCAAAGVVAYKVAGPPAVPAKYEPAKDSTMVIVVENFKYPTATRNDSDQIARYLYENMREHNAVPLKSPDDLYELRSADPIEYSKMTIEHIGAAVGAGQVLYVNLTQGKVDLTPGTNILQGHMSALVRVVDVHSGATLWPSGGSDGYPVNVETPYVEAKQGINESNIREQMYHHMAQEIGRLFYTYKPENLEEPELNSQFK